MKDDGPTRAAGDGTQYLAAAMRLAAAVVVFLLGGLWLDRRLHLTPLFTIVGALGGAVLGFWSVYREFQGDPDHKGDTRPWSERRPR